MELELEKIELDQTKLTGKDILSLTAETQIQIRTREQGQDVVLVLNESVPA